MTRQEAVEILTAYRKNAENIYRVNEDTGIVEGHTVAFDTAIEALKIQDESKTKNIIYDFLIAKLGEDIMNNPFKFEDWFNRMVWHVQECHKLNKKLLMNTGGYDLISRQAAIDVLETVGYDFSDSELSEIELEEVCEVVGDVRQDMINRIKHITSAQPEQR